LKFTYKFTFIIKLLLIIVFLNNLSLLKTGKVKAIRFTTLAAICAELGCQPGDILEYVAEQRG